MRHPARSEQRRSPGLAAPVLLLLVLVGAWGCGPKVWNPTLRSPEDVPPERKEAPFLKAHLHSGDLVVFRSWGRPAGGPEARLRGDGVRFDAMRRVVGSGEMDVSVDSVALLESNDRETVSGFATANLAILSATSAYVTVYCLSDPKACFGSCPTFYTEGDEGERLHAEGFSSSFARVLEETDVDALRGVRVEGRSLSLVMRNEAPETHAVRGVRILAVPTEPGRRVVATPGGTFHRVREELPPGSCAGGSGECLDAVIASDGREVFSTADPDDLAAREEVILELPAVDGSAGIVLEARNTLLTTFLFYQTIAYLGEDAGAWLAALERGDAAVRERALGLARELGGIEVAVREGGGGWRVLGTWTENGPIASDEQVFPFEGSGRAPLRVRLRMARGNWRVDRVAAVLLDGPTRPVALEPVRVRGPAGEDPAALAALRDPERYLVTVRGDAYTLDFELPGEGEDLALFLESRGYYYEWLRPEWSGEANPVMAALVFGNPREALRVLAPAFKRREAGMEETFWTSRFRRMEP